MNSFEAVAIPTEAAESVRKRARPRSTGTGSEDAEAQKLFANRKVKYIHVRRTDAGCYLFRLDRH